MVGLTAPEERPIALEILEPVLEPVLAAGARDLLVAVLLGVGLTTLQRWRRQLTLRECGEGFGG